MVMAIGVGILVVLGIMMIIVVRNKRKRILEERFQAAKKVREESLKEALANNLEPSADMDVRAPYRPYKVDYSTGEGQDYGEKLPLLQIIEKNKLSEKKYIFRASEMITLGVQFGSVDILNNMENGEGWCELYFQKDVYCARSLGNHRVLIQRKKHTAEIDRFGIKLRSKDIIKIEDTTFQIFYVKG